MDKPDPAGPTRLFSRSDPGHAHAGANDAANRDPFFQALNDAEELLKYLAEVGKEVDADIIKKILVARDAVTTKAVTEDVRANFYSAFTKLSTICGDVTARTIRNCSAPETLRALARNQIIAVVLTLAIATMSVITFVTDDMSKKILAGIDAGNQYAATLRAGLSDDKGNPVKLDPGYAKIDPCTQLAKEPNPGDPVVRSVDDVTRLQALASTNRDLIGRALKLNWVIRHWECDPFHFDKCNEQDGNEAALTPAERARRIADLNTRLQINPSILNYTAEVLCKIQTFQQVRTFASNVQADYASMIGAITAFALPILYAWLGAFAYRLRAFGETIRHKTYHPSFADSARMITAVIAGAIVGLFNPSQGISLSPLATAFLVGYGVELFFRFLDTLINFGAPSRPGGTPGA